jgi:hypothetical protein
MMVGASKEIHGNFARRPPKTPNSEGINNIETRNSRNDAGLKPNYEEAWLQNILHNLIPEVLFR